MEESTFRTEDSRVSRPPKSSRRPPPPVQVAIQSASPFELDIKLTPRPPVEKRSSSANSFRPNSASELKNPPGSRADLNGSRSGTPVQSLPIATPISAFARLSSSPVMNRPASVARAMTPTPQPAQFSESVATRVPIAPIAVPSLPIASITSAATESTPSSARDYVRSFVNAKNPTFASSAFVTPSTQRQPVVVVRESLLSSLQSKAASNTFSIEPIVPADLKPTSAYEGAVKASNSARVRANNKLVDPSIETISAVQVNPVLKKDIVADSSLSFLTPLAVSKDAKTSAQSAVSKPKSEALESSTQPSLTAPTTSGTMMAVREIESTLIQRFDSSSSVEHRAQIKKWAEHSTALFGEAMNKVIAFESSCCSPESTLLEEFMRRRNSDGSSFGSILVLTQMRLSEMYQQTHGCPLPSVYRTLVCCDLLDKLCSEGSVLGPLRVPLMCIKDELFRALFAGYDADEELQNPLRLSAVQNVAPQNRTSSGNLSQVAGLLSASVAANVGLDSIAASPDALNLARSLFSDKQIAFNSDTDNLKIAVNARRGRREFVNTLYFCCLGKLEAELTVWKARFGDAALELSRHRSDIARGQNRLLFESFRGWRAYVMGRKRLAFKLQSVFHSLVSAEPNIRDVFIQWRLTAQRQKVERRRLILSGEARVIHDQDIDNALFEARQERCRRERVEAQFEALVKQLRHQQATEVQLRARIADLESELDTTKRESAEQLEQMQEDCKQKLANQAHTLKREFQAENARRMLAAQQQAKLQAKQNDDDNDTAGSRRRMSMSKRSSMESTVSGGGVESDNDDEFEGLQRRGSVSMHDISRRGSTAAIPSRRSSVAQPDVSRRGSMASPEAAVSRRGSMVGRRSSITMTEEANTAANSSAEPVSPSAPVSTSSSSMMSPTLNASNSMDARRGSVASRRTSFALPVSSSTLNLSVSAFDSARRPSVASRRVSIADPHLAQAASSASSMALGVGLPQGLSGGMSPAPVGRFNNAMAAISSRRTSFAQPDLSPSGRRGSVVPEDISPRSAAELASPNRRNSVLPSDAAAAAAVAAFNAKAKPLPPPVTSAGFQIRLDSSNAKPRANAMFVVTPPVDVAIPRSDRASPTNAAANQPQRGSLKGSNPARRMSVSIMSPNTGTMHMPGGPTGLSSETLMEENEDDSLDD